MCARRWGLAAIVAVALVGAVPANAESIFLSESFTANPVGLIGLAPFDPTLGTLDRVNVQITGQLSVDGLAFPVDVPPAGPQPYLIRVSVEQDFEGLANQFFDFSTNAVLTSPDLLVLNTFSWTTAYGYSFSFTPTTDLIGGTPVSSVSTSSGTLTPPVIVTGTRASFIEQLIGVNTVQASLANPLALGVSGPNGAITTFTTSGQLFVEYVYTPTPVTTTVPEPTTLSLLTLGVAGLAARRRVRGVR